MGAVLQCAIDHPETCGHFNYCQEMKQSMNDLAFHYDNNITDLKQLHAQFLKIQQKVQIIQHKSWIFPDVLRDLRQSCVTYTNGDRSRIR